MFSKAKYVVDRFHYTRYIMDALDKIRIRLQKEFEYRNFKFFRLRTMYILNGKISGISKKDRNGKKFKNNSYQSQKKLKNYKCKK